MTQSYDTYTSHDHAVWKTLFDRQVDQLKTLACKSYLEGLKRIGFKSETIPDFEKETSPVLKASTGWQVVVVKGLVSEAEFFQLMSRKLFPSSRWLRRMDQLDYLEEPDMFHDTFGHLPLLTNADFCSFLLKLSDIALIYIESPEAIELVKRLYWFTVEFGLIKEDHQIKAYGGGLISSIGECDYAIHSHLPERIDFNLFKILDTPVKIDEYQKQYFVIDSFEQLFQSLGDFESILSERTGVGALN
ncbi:phenylalanine 4-monooxygenase [Emticicia sp. CRIBPO]|uniref:phenylalanine 4-monooxygenase n=1 Tax=Emticicia sp. CRIBPO TaxID=2683258 RepID=UPI001411D26E|nr:phenylalanine 4-monooxygenase [Emticicia sp. CRIBPO]NBA85055.1 phenylalanine 4-monooxygenase [Emticicia sp. CRIBPO]